MSESNKNDVPVQTRMQFAKNTFKYFIRKSLAHKASSIKIKTSQQLKNIVIQDNGEGYDSKHLFYICQQSNLLKQLSSICNLSIQVNKNSQRTKNTYKNGKTIESETKFTNYSGTIVKIKDLKLLKNQQEQQLYLQQYIDSIKNICLAYLLHFKEIKFQIQIQHERYLSTNYKQSKNGQQYQLLRTFSKLLKVRELDIIYFFVQIKQVKLRVITTKLFTTKQRKIICFINGQMIEDHSIIDSIIKVYSECYQSFQKPRYGFKAYVQIKTKSEINLKEDVKLFQMFKKYLKQRIIKRQQIKVFNYEKCLDCIKIDAHILNKVYQFVNSYSKVSLCVENKTKYSLLNKELIKQIKLFKQQSIKQYKLIEMNIQCFKIVLRQTKNNNNQQIKQKANNDQKSQFTQFVQQSQLISNHSLTDLIVLHKYSLYSIDLKQLLNTIFKMSILTLNILIQVYFSCDTHISQLLTIFKQQKHLNFNVQKYTSVLISSRMMIYQKTFLQIDFNGLIRKMVYPRQMINKFNPTEFGYLLFRIVEKIIKHHKIDTEYFIEQFSEYLKRVCITEKFSSMQQRLVYQNIIYPVLISNQIEYQSCQIKNVKILNLYEVLKQFDRC